MFKTIDRTMILITLGCIIFAGVWILQLKGVTEDVEKASVGKLFSVGGGQ